MSKAKIDIRAKVLERTQRFFKIYCGISVLLLLRILWVQFFSPEIAYNTKRMLEEKIYDTMKIKAHRGDILARNGDPLAISLKRYQVDVDFGSTGFDSLRTFERMSDSLSRLLSAYFKDRSAAEYRRLMINSHTKNYQLKYRGDSIVPRSEKLFTQWLNILRGRGDKTIKLYDTLRNHRPVTLLPRFVDYSEWQELRTYPILNWNMGMTYHLREEEQRIYPNGGMARRTIGALGVDRKNDFGIEKIFDKELRGEDGLMRVRRIARGFYGRVPDGDNKEAIDGLDIVTTIDIDIQDVVDRALLEQCEKHEAIWGTSIVMEVETGDILAISNLDQQRDGSYKEGENRAIGARTEPGSTFKLLSTMALIEEAEMPTSTIYDTEDGRRVRIGNARVQDSHGGYNEINLRTAFTQSLNVYYGKAIFENFGPTPEKYVNMLRRIGFEQGVGFEAFGEPKPILPNPETRYRWYKDMTIVNLGYGYGLEVTPMQTISYFNAVANGGQRMKPRLITEIKRDDKVIERFPVRKLGDPIASRSTIDTLRSYMEEVCASGTGKLHLGKFEGFKAAAKTGTAQFAQGDIKYGDWHYIGSMVAYMPAENPKYTVMTALHVDRKRRKGYYGATVAGPSVKKILQHLYNRELAWQAKIDTIKTRHYPIAIKGGEADAVQEVAKELLPSSLRNGNATAADNRWVRTQLDSVDRISFTELSIKDNVMPNVYGLGLQDAMFILENHGLRVNFVGEGKVWRQSIRSGQRFRDGSTVTLTLR